YPRSYSTLPISGGARYGSGARKTGRPGSGSSGWQTTGSRNRESFIRGQRVASPSDTQGGSRMPELGPYGSVRGARGNSPPYRDSDWAAVKTGLFALKGHLLATQCNLLVSRINKFGFTNNCIRYLGE